jgi:DNA-binding transcriptional ArsR family regulator
MKDILILKDLEQIKALSSPYRIQILEAFDNQPANTKMIAELMMEQHAKINYHIKALYKVGLLELVEEVQRSGIVEKFYQPVARNFVVDSGSMRMGDSEISNSVNQYRIALFETISTAFYGALDLKNSPTLKIQLASDVYMTDEELLELSERMKGIMNDVGLKYKEKRPNTHRYLTANLIVAEKEHLKGEQDEK